MISVFTRKISKLGNIGKRLKLRTVLLETICCPIKKQLELLKKIKIFRAKKEELLKLMMKKIKIATEKLKKYQILNIYREASDKGHFLVLLLLEI